MIHTSDKWGEITETVADINNKSISEVNFIVSDPDEIKKDVDVSYQIKNKSNHSSVIKISHIRFILKTLVGISVSKDLKVMSNERDRSFKMMKISSEKKNAYVLKLSLKRIENSKATPPVVSKSLESFIKSYSVKRSSLISFKTITCYRSKKLKLSLKSYHDIAKVYYKGFSSVNTIVHQDFLSNF